MTSRHDERQVSGGEHSEGDSNGGEGSGRRHHRRASRRATGHRSLSNHRSSTLNGGSGGGGSGRGAEERRVTEHRRQRSLSSDREPDLEPSTSAAMETDRLGDPGPMGPLRKTSPVNLASSGKRRQSKAPGHGGGEGGSSGGRNQLHPSPKRASSGSSQPSPGGASQATCSRTSLLGKHGSAISYSAGSAHPGLTQGLARGGAQANTAYTKVGMEVAVAALILAAGTVALIVALVMQDYAWIIVGSITMAIGGVFLTFGIGFYVSRSKAVMEVETADHVEIRIVNTHHIRDLARKGYKVTGVMENL